jgi:hypothetical protein
MGRDSAIQLRERYSGVFVVGMGLALQETQRDRLARQTVTLGVPLCADQSVQWNPIELTEPSES